MNMLPPPDHLGDVLPEPTEDRPTSSRRRLAIAAVIATTLGVGGIAVGAQLANAGTDRTPAPTDTSDDEAPDTDTDDLPDTDADEETDQDPDDSSNETSDDDEGDSSDDEPGDSEPDSDTADETRPGLPALDELDAAFEEFEACLAEQLPDVFGEGGLFDDAMLFDDIPATVTVFAPGDGGELGELTTLNLGDGDGSITITQTDGEIEITSDGDVEEFDLADLDQLGDELAAEWETKADEFDAAHDACIHLLADLGDLGLGDLGDLADIDLGDLADIDLGDLADFDLGDLEDFDLGDLEDFDLGDLGKIDLGDFDFEDFDFDFDFEDFDLGDFGDFGDVDED